MTTAYDAFLSGEELRSVEILNRAGDMPEAQQFDRGSSSFAEFGLRAFKQPKNAYRARRRMQKQLWESRKVAAGDCSASVTR